MLLAVLCVLFVAVFGGRFQRTRGTFGISFAGECHSTPTLLSLRTCWLSLLTWKKPVILCRSFSWQKRPLFCTQSDSIVRFQRAFNSASLLYRSARPKRHEQFNGCLKDLSEPVQQTKHCAKLGHPWDPSGLSSSLPVSEETFVDLKKLSSLAKEQVAHEQQSVKLNDPATADGSSEASVQSAAGAGDAKGVEAVPAKKPGLFKRFHQTYKQYGKVLVAVHIFTSTIWTGLFYTMAMSGIDVEPALRWIGAGETIISFYTMPGVGHLAVAYLLYKLATPARYMVTIGGTHLAVKVLRNWGYMQPIPESESFRSLVKDGKTKVKAKYEEYQDRMEDMRDEMKERASKERKLK